MAFLSFTPAKNSSTKYSIYDRAYTLCIENRARDWHTISVTNENELNILNEPWTGPAILLVDLDAFFASVEQLDHPGWRGKPVIVGGDAHRRGVVATASYEARKYGVHSAMPSATAERLCPDAIWTPGHFDRYREVSNKVMQILRDETPHVQQVSIDEAFMDVTPNNLNRESPIKIAERIQKRVEQLGVTCSIGVGSSKSIAKIASDMDKPRGLTVVLPGSELGFIEHLPVRALSGIGPAFEKKLHERGIETLGDLYAVEDEPFIAAFGKMGKVVLDRVRGLEDATVSDDTEVKSVSSEMSFAHDYTQREDINAAIDTMAAKVGRRLRRKSLKGATLTLKVRYDNLRIRSNQVSLPQPSDDEYVFQELLHDMLDELWQPGMRLRLVGVAVSGFDNPSAEGNQLSLFEDEAQSAPVVPDRSALLGATDKVKERFGEEMLIYGRELRLKDQGTGTSSKNPADYK